MKMENWCIFGRFKDIQVEQLLSQDERSQVHAMSVLLCSGMTNRVLIDDGERWILQGDEQESENRAAGVKALYSMLAATTSGRAKELVKQRLSERNGMIAFGRIRERFGEAAGVAKLSDVFQFQWTSPDSLDDKWLRWQRLLRQVNMTSLGDDARETPTIAGLEKAKERALEQHLRLRAPQTGQCCVQVWISICERWWTRASSPQLRRRLFPFSTPSGFISSHTYCTLKSFRTRLIVAFQNDSGKTQDLWWNRQEMRRSTLWALSVQNTSLPFDHTCCLDKSELETCLGFLVSRNGNRKLQSELFFFLLFDVFHQHLDLRHKHTNSWKKHVLSLRVLVSFWLSLGISVSKGSSSSSFRISTSARDSSIGSVSSLIDVTSSRSGILITSRILLYIGIMYLSSCP